MSLNNTSSLSKKAILKENEGLPCQLRLCLPMQQAWNSIPGEGTKVPDAAECGQKFKNERYFFKREVSYLVHKQTVSPP